MFNRLLRRSLALLAASALLLGTWGTSNQARAEEPTNEPKTLVYVEVNDHDFANVADYTLKGTNRPAFDIGVIFAANINYDTAKKKAYLHFNERVTETLNNADKQIRPVQARGTKVLLSILGNHQGAGFANFGSYAEADAFAAELADAVTKYGLDGIDFDDEYAGYGKNGTSAPNDFSFVYLVKALRARLGNEKIINFYNIGPAKDAMQYNGENAADWLDYAYNPYYGQWNVPPIRGMKKSQLGPGAVEIAKTNRELAGRLAQRTIDEGWGIFVTYNLSSADNSAYLSQVTVPIKGLSTVYKQVLPTPTPNPTATSKPTPTSEPTPTVDPTPTAEPTPTVEPTATRGPTPSLTPLVPPKRPQDGVPPRLPPATGSVGDPALLSH